MANRSISILTATLLLGFGSCDRDTCYQFNAGAFTTNINRGEHLSVYASGGWAYAQGGACGLIVYNGGARLVAYDRCSTVSMSDGNAVNVDGMIVFDPISGAKWLLHDGSPTEIAECHLKRYRVSRSGDLYYVSND